MDLRTLISLILPGESYGYRQLGERLGCTGAAIHHWNHNPGKLPIKFVERLVFTPGHDFTLQDFRPFCSELDNVFRLIEKEAEAAK